MTQEQYRDELSSITEGIGLLASQYHHVDNNCSGTSASIDLYNAREGIAAYRRYRGLLVRWFWESRIGNPPTIPGVKP